MSLGNTGKAVVYLTVLPTILLTVLQFRNCAERNNTRTRLAGVAAVAARSRVNSSAAIKLY